MKTVQCYYAELGHWFMMDPYELKWIVDLINYDVREKGFISLYKIEDILNCRRLYGNNLNLLLGFTTKVRVKLVYINAEDPRVIYLYHQSMVTYEDGSYPI